MDRCFKTACPYDCPDACPFVVNIEPGGGLKLSADPAFSFGSGFICRKGSRWDSIRLHPERLKSPLKRIGSSWEEISWESAWALWASRTEESISRLGPLSVFFSRGYGSLYFSKNLLGNVFTALGGYTTTAGSLCGAAGGAGLKKAFGRTPVMHPETVADCSKGVLLWGRNAAETNIHLLPLLRKLRNRGGSVAAIEIRETPTTRYSDRWWCVHPGSDQWLALMLCAKILGSGAISDSWKKHVTNSAAFEKMLSELDRDQALTCTGLNERDVEDIADWLLQNRPVALYPGYGIQRYNAGSDTFHALAALAVLLGGLEERGSGVVFGKDEMALFPEGFTRNSPIRRRLPLSSWYSGGNIEPPLGVAVFCGANPAKQSPGSEVFVETMSKIPFKVCCDFFMTETAKICDLVLPSALFLEEGPDWRGSWWHQFALRSTKIVDPPKGVLTDLQIFSGFARKMGIDMDLEELRREMDRSILGDPRLKLISEGLYSWGEPETWGNSDAKVIFPDTVPEMLPSHPGLMLITVHDYDYINGQTFFRKRPEGIPEACVSPGYLERQGFADDTTVLIRGKCGSLEATLKGNAVVREGICLMKQGDPGVNNLTVPLASSGYGAPFHENSILITVKAGD